VNVISSRAAAAMADSEYVRVSRIRNADDRQEFFNQANARMVRWIDSQTNFVMIKPGQPAANVVAHFESNLSSGPLRRLRGLRSRGARHAGANAGGLASVGPDAGRGSSSLMIKSRQHSLRGRLDFVVVARIFFFRTAVRMRKRLR
jgi:hypothetical protein